MWANGGVDTITGAPLMTGDRIFLKWQTHLTRRKPEERTICDEDKNDGADWLIVTAGTDTPETATCTTFNACDHTSTANSLE